MNFSVLNVTLTVSDSSADFCRWHFLFLPTAVRKKHYVLTDERIENAIKQAKIRIDPNEHAETQISRIMDALKPLIPISIEQVEVNLRIPIQFAGRVRSELSKRAVIQKDTWGASEWICQVRFYAGMKSEIYDTLNRLTNGQLISEEEKQ